MNEHAKKIIAPVVVVVCITLYYGVVAGVVVHFALPALVKIAVVLFSVLVTGAFIAVLIERIKEIQQGEEDDISKY